MLIILVHIWGLMKARLASFAKWNRKPEGKHKGELKLHCTRKYYYSIRKTAIYKSRIHPRNQTSTNRCALCSLPLPVTHILLAPRITRTNEQGEMPRGVFQPRPDYWTMSSQRHRSDSPHNARNESSNIGWSGRQTLFPCSRSRWRWGRC